MSLESPVRVARPRWRTVVAYAALAPAVGLAALFAVIVVRSYRPAVSEEVPARLVRQGFAVTHAEWGAKSRFPATLHFLHLLSPPDARGDRYVMRVTWTPTQVCVLCCRQGAGREGYAQDPWTLTVAYPRHAFPGRVDPDAGGGGEVDARTREAMMAHCDRVLLAVRGE
jgi:hypothetical protein